MLAAILTCDMQGRTIVPYVDATKDTIFDLLEAFDGTLFVRSWMLPLLPAGFSRFHDLDEIEPDWSEVVVSGRTHVVFYEEQFFPYIDTFYQIVLSDEEELDSAILAPNMDLERMVVELADLDDGRRLLQWSWRGEPEFAAEEVVV